MTRTRILGIAPYEGMQSLMKQAAGDREDIELTVYVGDLEAGAAIARMYTDADFDAIVSRGGTAELIRRVSPIPVIEIPLSVHDILRSIKLAENFHDKYAIIGFPAITRNARFLCDVLRYPIDIHTIRNEAEARERLEALAGGGCNMVLCDVITKSLAQQLGIPAILITSGMESVESAFDQAALISSTYRRLAHQIQLFKAVLEERNSAIVIYSEAGDPIYATHPGSQPEAVMQKMAAAVPAVLSEPHKKILHCETAGSLYTLTGVSRQIGGQSYAAFLASARKAPVSLSRNGIVFSSKEEAYDQFFNSFYGITQPAAVTNMTVEQYAGVREPLMILGETGTGKDQMARLLYAKSKLCNNSLVTIDCACLNDRSWSYLLESDHSPLCGSNMTLYLREARTLPEQQRLRLFNTLKDLGVHQRNRLLLTYSRLPGQELDAWCQRIMHQFSCLTLDMPPLRDFKDSIPNLASLYISILNMRLARNIIGFEPDALSCLRAYDWPYNFDQFKRVIQELVTLGEGSYIGLALTEKILRRENQRMYAAVPPADFAPDLKGTLEEINLSIVRQVLAQEKGNQNAAARRLGISRTTLWRMLQKVGPVQGPDTAR